MPGGGVNGRAAFLESNTMIINVDQCQIHKYKIVFEIEQSLSKTEKKELARLFLKHI